MVRIGRVKPPPTPRTDQTQGTGRLAEGVGKQGATSSRPAPPPDQSPGNAGAKGSPAATDSPSQSSISSLFVGRRLEKDFDARLAKAKLGRTEKGLATKLKSSVARQALVSAQKSSRSDSVSVTELAGQSFEKGLGANPFEAAGANRLRNENQSLRSVKGYSEVVRTVKLAANNPTSEKLQQRLGEQVENLSKQAGTDPMAALYSVFRESIAEQAEDKRYWAQKLGEHNQIADALSSHLKELKNRLQQLQEDTPSASEVDGNSSTREVLDAEINSIEADRETVRNERQLCTTQFENANQKASQYVNMLARVLKAMKEMNSGVVRNLR